MLDNNAGSVGVFPRTDIPDSIKNTDAYGLATAKAIHAATKPYIEARNAKFQNTRLYYKGRQPVAPYLDLLNINGKQAFIDIQFKPRPIAKKFVKIITDGYMPKKETPSVKSTNPIVADRKQDLIDRAKWKITHKDFINNVQTASNMQLEETGSYLPSTVEEAEFYYGLNNKQREEFLLEMMIQFALTDNNYPVKKRRILKDLLLHNVAGVHDYMDGNNRLVFEAIPAEELIYGPSKEEDFSDAPYFGRYKRMSVSKFRQLPNMKLTEEQVYEVAKSFQNKNGNGTVNFPFNTGWANATIRPYDGYVIDVMFIWYRTTKNITYVSGVNKSGRTIFDMDSLTAPDFSTKTSQTTLGNKPIYVGYEGYWVVNSDYMVNWGPSENMLKRDDELEKVESPISVYMIDNDGEFDSKSIVEDMISSIVEMDLDILKIQQIKAQQAPNGLLIDIEGLEDIDLGLGRGSLKPLELREIRSQMGDVYYRSRNEPGDNNQGPPVKELKGDFGNQLTELINNYNFELANIRDYIGVNEYRDGSTLNPKTGLGVLNAQVQTSNTATAHIYDALIQIVKRLERHIGQRIWDSLRHGTPSAGYKAILGQENLDFIKASDDITASLYDIDIEVDMSDEEKQNLEEEIKIALSSGTLEPKDIAAIRNMPTSSYAAQYLSFVSAKNKADQIKIAASNAQANAMQSNSAIITKGQVELQIAQVTAQSGVNIVEAKIQGEMAKKKADFYDQMRLQSFILGKDLPPDIQKEIEQYNEQQQQMQIMAAQQMMQEKAQAQQQQQAQAQQQQDQQGQPQGPNPVQTQ